MRILASIAFSAFAWSLPLLSFAAFEGYKITTPFARLKAGQTYSIAQYISTILTFSFGAIGVVALGAIVYWSLKWILSQGSSSAIAQAKEGMWSAVWGVVLLFASYVILNTINPALVDLQATESSLTLPRVTAPTSTPTSTLTDCSVVIAHGLSCSDPYTQNNGRVDKNGKARVLGDYRLCKKPSCP